MDLHPNHPFVHTLTKSLESAFKTPEYRYAKQCTTPSKLAITITTNFVKGHPPLIGQAIKTTCSSLNIPPKETAIRHYILTQTSLS